MKTLPGSTIGEPTTRPSSTSAIETARGSAPERKTTCFPSGETSGVLQVPGTIRVGDRVVRRSTIASVKQKDGASGPLVFVTVRHEIGATGQAPAIVDEHDIAERGLQAPAVKAERQKAEPGIWRRTLKPDAGIAR